MTLFKAIQSIRFRKEAWKSWQEGIEQNMRRPAFRQAWDALDPDLNGSFSDLRVLISEDHTK